MRNKKEDKQAAAVETKIIIMAFEVIKRKKETLKVDLENLTQTEFPEIKIVAESFEKTRFQNNANEEVLFEIYTQEHTDVDGRRLKRRRRASRRREANRTIGKLGSQRNEVDTMVDYCTDISAAVVISECRSILKRDDMQIIDSRATCHSTFCAQGGRNGETVTAVSKGTASDKQMPNLVYDLENCAIPSKAGNSRDRCSLVEFNYRED